MPIDNDFYNHERWWDDDAMLSLLRLALNPGRFAYFRGVLSVLRIDPRGMRALDIGCGGGFLAEEFARLGCDVAGIDPSTPSLDEARVHAAQSGLAIDYREGAGEAISYDDATFDIVYCCDVLEHVRDLEKVIAETARVLKPGGVYFFDTLNRTFLSKMLTHMMQDWRWTRFAPPNLHDWKMFIKPSELVVLLARNGIDSREIIGLRPDAGPIALLRVIRSWKRGKVTLAAFGQRITFVPSKDTRGLYMGYAVKLAVA